MRARFLHFGAQCPQQISNRVPTGQHTFSNLENTGGAGNWAPGHTQFTHTDEIDKASMGQPTRVRVRERPTGDSVTGSCCHSGGLRSVWEPEVFLPVNLRVRSPLQKFRSAGQKVCRE